MEDYKEFIPWALGIVTTILALKKDWIQSKFTKDEKKLEVLSTQEDVESKQLDNVEKHMGVYRAMVEDLKNNIEDLKSDLTTLKQEIVELKLFIEEQKVFIQKQSDDLDFFEGKYGKR